MSDWNIQSLIDQAPFQQIRSVLSPYAAFKDWPLVEDYNRLGIDLDLRFVVQASLGQRKKWRLRKLRKQGRVGELERYDGRITLRKEIPTRQRNWHDFFNMTVWQLFPMTKKAIHREAFEASEQHKAAGQGNRCRLHDRITIFDEGGVLVLTDEGRFDEISALLRLPNVAAKENLLRQGQLRVIIFGHALFEAIHTGSTGINAMAIPLPWRATFAAGADFAALDRKLALHLPQLLREEECFGSLPLEALIT